MRFPFRRRRTPPMPIAAQAATQIRMASRRALRRARLAPSEDPILAALGLQEPDAEQAEHDDPATHP
jgi:hypothetical protein